MLRQRCIAPRMVDLAEFVSSMFERAAADSGAAACLKDGTRSIGTRRIRLLPIPVKCEESDSWLENC